ncbi:delta 8-sphingoloid desaturase protein [Desarmillaria tabescens]|uniref:Delta 8-(E)-sphingolipid desaturase n=1 Tax=Armillaria tabescens TaxID=1929756 RepID=A0AA39NG70_ARMTA|nr:delta 8-sphingoloid desaturase protein [Desarmillaria tabescens]KAK0464888.1 delta 8-sphingoloid desaturase protein [Desarmillaria tabescens]
MSLRRDEVESLILKGQHIVIYHDNVLRIPNKWLDAHPGGALSILHFVGRDATDEIDALHPTVTLDLIAKYSIGKHHEKYWVPFLPPIAAGWVQENGQWRREAAYLSGDQRLLVEEHLSSSSLGPTAATITPGPTDLDLDIQARQSAAYKALHRRIINAGLYKCPILTGYGPEFIRYTLLGLISAYAYYHNWLMTSAFFLGLMWHQLMFFAHDLGHMGLTGDWTFDRLVSTIIADWIGGLSIGWWVDNHNIHHIVTNHVNHDPDIQHLPFFAISPAFFNNLYSSYYKRTMPLDAPAKIFLTLQHKLFYIVMMFARLNLYRLSYAHLYFRAFDTRRARGHGWAWGLEVAGIVFFWTWFGSLLIGCGTWRKALLYVLVSHATTSPLHVQIVLSHFSMSTADLGPTESFPHRQLRTTSDVICDESIEFIHGGLHLQVTHHLFPRLPRHNLRKASEMVKKFAEEQGLTYAEFGFVSGNKEVVGLLKHVGELVNQVKIVAEVADAEAKEAVDKKIKGQEEKKVG